MPSQTKIFTLRAPIMAAYRGEANGYVSIPVLNPLHGKDYCDDVFSSVSVHGGLTWSSLAKELRGVPSDIDPESWVVGFDTCHYGDNCEKWTLEAVIRESESLKSQIDAIAEELHHA